jgi:DNA-nicking Smr family endonuclease
MNPFDPLDGDPSDSIDLHGLTVPEAKAAAIAFLRRTKKSHSGTLVHIITGRGRNSARGRPVLLPAVKAAAASLHPAVVAAWGNDDADGGVLVRLAR